MPRPPISSLQGMLVVLLSYLRSGYTTRNLSQHPLPVDPAKVFAGKDEHEIFKMPLLERHTVCLNCGQRNTGVRGEGQGEISKKEGTIEIRSAFGGIEEPPLKTFKLKINDNEHAETLVTCAVSEKFITDLLVSKGAYETLRERTELQSPTVEKGKVYGKVGDGCEGSNPLGRGAGEREVEHVLSWKGEVKEK
ncbi:hypothetical protein AVEN_132091-1 [Araneus ventricosus]|uniref:Uncharacterized protein n=1 Tax=Araneus ventricosus TaxID=182803 RepID=A0A4Y2F9H2_ARAVE|nr:hypothetical protein AVEN_132091-1 [Araneus ventricosus]